MGQATGLCRECLAEEVERAIAGEHPELRRGDVFELVQEWLQTGLEWRHHGLSGGSAARAQPPPHQPSAGPEQHGSPDEQTLG